MVQVDNGTDYFKVTFGLKLHVDDRRDPIWIVDDPDLGTLRDVNYPNRLLDLTMSDS